MMQAWGVMDGDASSHVDDIAVVQGDPDHGNYAIATKDGHRGSVVLLEAPIVFAPSVHTLSSVASYGKGMALQCWACGAILMSLADDYARCKAVNPEFFGTLPQCSLEAACVPHVSITLGHHRVVYLCDDTTRRHCQAIAWTTLGLQFLQWTCTSKDIHHTMHPTSPTTTTLWPGIPDDAHLTLLWGSLPTNHDDAVEALCCIGDRYNERVYMMMKLICRWLQEWTTGREKQDHRDDSFDVFVEHHLSQFAEGAPQQLTPQRRSLLRFTTQVINVWLSTTSAASCGDVSLTPQRMLQMTWVLDANSHTYIVTCPLYAWAQGSHSREQEGTVKPLDDTDGHTLMIDALRVAFACADHAALHSSGAALYDKGSKFNHSCSPNVKFMPTLQCAAACVVLQEDVKQGDELRTSYIDVSTTGKYPSASERMFVLQQNYGFDCDCPLCHTSR